MIELCCLHTLDFAVISPLNPRPHEHSFPLLKSMLFFPTVTEPSQDQIAPNSYQWIPSFWKPLNSLSRVIIGLLVHLKQAVEMNRNSETAYILYVYKLFRVSAKFNDSGQASVQ